MTTQQPNLELSKTREFSDLISDTFQFIRENFKPLITCFFVLCGFFMVANFVLLFMQELKILNTTTTIVTDPNNFDVSSPSTAFSRIFGWQYFLTLLFGMLTYSVMIITVTSYMAVYKKKGNQPATVEEVWGYLKYYLFKIFGSGILLALLLVIAFVCCLIPGIWLYPIVGLMFPIMIVENASLSYAFNQSFRIIKGNWWTTFGALFISAFIAGVALMVVAIPTSLLAFGSMYLHPNMAGVSKPFLALYLAFAEIGHVLYILPLVTLTLSYFSLNENKEGTGLMERINQMGNDTNTPDLPAEQY